MYLALQDLLALSVRLSNSKAPLSTEGSEISWGRSDQALEIAGSGW
jgi:hypothetical protein